MNGRTMDLRPTTTRDRVRVSRERDWITRMTVVASVLVSIAWLGGSWRLSAARADLAVATERAENVVQIERRLAEERAEVERTGRDLAAWRRTTIPFSTGGVVDSIVGVLPASATVERLELDAGPLIAVSAGIGRNSTDQPRRVKGEVEGFAGSDDDVAALVDALRGLQRFAGVRVVTTRHRDLSGDGEVARAFRIAFEIDLEGASPAPLPDVEKESDQ